MAWTTSKHNNYTTIMTCFSDNLHSPRFAIGVACYKPGRSSTTGMMKRKSSALFLRCFGSLERELVSAYQHRGLKELVSERERERDSLKEKTKEHTRDRLRKECEVSFQNWEGEREREREREREKLFLKILGHKACCKLYSVEASSEAFDEACEKCVKSV